VAPAPIDSYNDAGPAGRYAILPAKTTPKIEI